jgi:hypothetical protein
MGLFRNQPGFGTAVNKFDVVENSRFQNALSGFYRCTCGVLRESSYRDFRKNK